MTKHYDGDKCWEIIETFTHQLLGVEAFNLGNVIKYLYRYRKKGYPLEDLKKARHYLDRIIKKYEQKH